MSASVDSSESKYDPEKICRHNLQAAVVSGRREHASHRMQHAHEALGCLGYGLVGQLDARAGEGSRSARSGQLLQQRERARPLATAQARTKSSEVFCSPIV